MSEQITNRMLNDELGAQDARITAVEGDVSGLTGDVGQLQTDLGALDTRVSAVEDAVQYVHAPQELTSNDVTAPIDLWFGKGVVADGDWLYPVGELAQYEVRIELPDGALTPDIASAVVQFGPTSAVTAFSHVDTFPADGTPGDPGAVVPYGDQISLITASSGELRYLGIRFTTASSYPVVNVSIRAMGSYTDTFGKFWIDGEEWGGVSNFFTAPVGSVIPLVESFAPGGTNTAGLVLTADGAGNYNWVAPSGGGGSVSPGAANTVLTTNSAGSATAWSLIGAANLATNSVQATKIADNNVVTSKIMNLNVTTAKIADSAITAVKLADANVTAAKLAGDVTTITQATASNVLTLIAGVTGFSTSTLGCYGRKNGKFVQISGSFRVAGTSVPSSINSKIMNFVSGWAPIDGQMYYLMNGICDGGGSSLGYEGNSSIPVYISSTGVYLARTGIVATDTTVYFDFTYLRTGSGANWPA